MSDPSNACRAVRGLPVGNYWYAERGTEPGSENWPWQPTLQLDAHVVTANIWFETREECETFIREQITGAAAHLAPTVRAAVPAFSLHVRETDG